MTQRDLALHLGVAGGERVSAWEAGRDVPRDPLVARAAEHLGVAVEELLPDERPLRIMRLRAGLTVPELARTVRVSERTVGRWESGDYVRLPAEATMARLADTLDVSAGALEQAFRQGRAART